MGCEELINKEKTGCIDHKQNMEKVPGAKASGGKI